MRIFLGILLLSVALNLADWPYVDEIFGGAGQMSELLGAIDKLPARHPPAAAHAHPGYQLLLAMQALPAAQRRVAALSSERILPHEIEPPRYLIPPRIDRPPAGTFAS